MSKNLKNWTPGEKLWMRRRMMSARQDKPYTQREAAGLYGVGFKKYKAAELDACTIDEGMLREITHGLGDLCALARRRHGLGLRETASLFGCTHVTLLAQEGRHDPELAKGWRRLGYRF